MIIRLVVKKKNPEILGRQLHRWWRENTVAVQYLFNFQFCIYWQGSVSMVMMVTACLHSVAMASSCPHPVTIVTAFPCSVSKALCHGYHVIPCLHSVAVVTACPQSVPVVTALQHSVTMVTASQHSHLSYLTVQLLLDIPMIPLPWLMLQDSCSCHTG